MTLNEVRSKKGLHDLPNWDVLINTIEVEKTDEEKDEEEEKKKIYAKIEKSLEWF
jgi:hypothetical protein